MGLIWSMYGIGYQGRVATWKVEEINYGDLTAGQHRGRARRSPRREDLPDPREIIEGNDILEAQFPDDPTVRAPQLGDLLSVDPTVADDPAMEGIAETDDGWHLLASADKQTGEAVAAASAYLVDERELFDLGQRVRRARLVEPGRQGGPRRTTPPSTGPCSRPSASRPGPSATRPTRSWSRSRASCPPRPVAGPAAAHAGGRRRAARGRPW